MQTHSGTHVNLGLGPYITSEHVKNTYVFWDGILCAIIILKCCSEYNKQDRLSSKVWLELQGEVQQAENNHILI